MHVCTKVFLFEKKLVSILLQKKQTSAVWTSSCVVLLLIWLRKDLWLQAGRLLPDFLLDFSQKVALWNKVNIYFCWKILAVPLVGIIEDYRCFVPRQYQLFVMFIETINIECSLVENMWKNSFTFSRNDINKIVYNN